MAANFNPELADRVGGDFLGYSKGIDVDTSAASLIKGTADFLSGAVATADNFVKNNIESQLQDHVDKVRNEFGVGAATDIADEIPADLNRSVDRIKSLGASAKAGNLKDSDYWARLNTEVRALRTRHPGYRDYIDSTVSKIAGTNPANALRSALQRELDDVSPEDKQYNKLLDFAATHAPYTAEQAAKMMANGKRISLDELRVRAYSESASIRNIEYEKAQLELRRSRRDFNKTGEIDSIYEVTAKKLNLELTGVMNSAFAELKAVGEATATPNMTPEAKAEAEARLNAVQAKISTKYAEVLNTRLSDGSTYGSILGNDPRAPAVLKNFTGQLEFYREAIKSDNLDALTIAKKANELQIEEGARNLLKGSEWVGGIAAVNKVMGPVAGNSFYSSNSAEINPEINKVIKSQVLGKALKGESIEDTIDQMRKAGIVGDKHTLGESVVKTVEFMSDKRTDIESSTKIAESLLKSDFLSKGDKPADRARLYQIASSPQTIDAMIRIRDSGRTDLWTKYRIQLSRGFANFNRDLISSAESIRFSNTQVSVAYDNDSHQFKLVARPGAETAAVYDRLFEDSRASAQKVIDNLNKAIIPVVKVSEASGLDKEKTDNIVLRTMIENGFNPFDKAISTGSVSNLGRGIAQATADFLGPDAINATKSVAELILGTLAGKVLDKDVSSIPAKLAEVNWNVNPALRKGDSRMNFIGMKPEFIDSLAKLGKDMPPSLFRAIEINEATRSKEYQDSLRKTSPRATTSDRSRHVIGGDAVDIAPKGGYGKKTAEFYAAIEWIHQNGPRYGIENPPNIRKKDPYHFQLIRNQGAN